jgi:hypothetical protein
MDAVYNSYITKLDILVSFGFLPQINQGALGSLPAFKIVFLKGNCHGKATARDIFQNKP